MSHILEQIIQHGVQHKWEIQISFLGSYRVLHIQKRYIVTNTLCLRHVFLGGGGGAGQGTEEGAPIDNLRSFTGMFSYNDAFVGRSSGGLVSINGLVLNVQ